MKRAVSEIVDDVRSVLKTSVDDNKRMTENLKKAQKLIFSFFRFSIVSKERKLVFNELNVRY